MLPKGSVAPLVPSFRQTVIHDEEGCMTPRHEKDPTHDVSHNSWRQSEQTQTRLHYRVEKVEELIVFRIGMYTFSPSYTRPETKSCRYLFYKLCRPVSLCQSFLVLINLKHIFSGRYSQRVNRKWKSCYCSLIAILTVLKAKRRRTS